MPKTRSTAARVSNVEAVRTILDTYSFYFIVNLDAEEGTTKGTISMWADDR